MLLTITLQGPRPYIKLVCFPREWMLDYLISMHMEISLTKFVEIRVLGTGS